MLEHLVDFCDASVACLLFVMGPVLLTTSELCVTCVHMQRRSCLLGSGSHPTDLIPQQFGFISEGRSVIITELEGTGQSSVRDARDPSVPGM